MRRLIGFMVTPLVLLSPLEGAGQPDQASRSEIALYPGATRLCSQHISGAPQGGKPGPHITWTGYTSTDPPTTVVAYYLKALGRDNHRREGREDIWRIPFDTPDSVLTVESAVGARAHPQCDSPPASAQTVIGISTMTRPR